jgi:hypothetical protein
MAPFRFENYTTGDGLPALSSELHIRDMPATRVDFPEDLRNRAQRASRIIADSLSELVERIRLVRDLPVGASLDPRKRHAVGIGLRQGSIDVEVIRPYQRKTLSLDLPRVGIVASAGVNEVNSDPGFIARITMLTIAVTWACEIIGAEVTAALTEGHIRQGQKPMWNRFALRSASVQRAQLAFILHEPGQFTPLQCYAVALDRDEFYSSGFAGAYRRDPRAAEVMGSLQGQRRARWESAHLSVDGGHAVDWARSRWDCDLVVAIGKVADPSAADIVLENDFTVEQACTSIAQQAAGMMQRT